jgi:Fibronectin type III domain/Chitobiase/beta-hexosaminidase C-terminal domain
MGGTSTSARRKRSALLGAAALTAGTLGALDALPASGSIGPAGLRPGKTITVVHNLDFVGVGGYRPLGREITVRVVRNGVTIGSATGRSTFVDGGTSGLEVNLGIEGTIVRPGDCWDGHTPDIRPGDHIVVAAGAARDEVVVDDIAFTGRPVLEQETGDVVVPFTAVDANGAEIPLERLDAAEFREDQVRYRAAEIALERAESGAAGQYQMRYVSPFAPERVVDDNDIPDPEEPVPTQADIARALLGDGHTIGFSAPVDGTGGEGMVAEGVTDTPGPAAGCEAAAPLASSGATSVSPRLVNQSNDAEPLVVSGFSEDAATVEVELKDADSVVTAPADLSAPAGRQTWRASFEPTGLADLSGTIHVAAVVDGARSPITQKAVRDTDAPVAPTVSLPAGSYRGPQGVTIGSDPSDEVRYTLGDGQQPDPTTDRGTVYRGGKLRIGSSKTLKVVSVDAAGNVSPVVARRYVIRKASSAPVIGLATSGDPGGRSTARASWANPATNNGGRVTGYVVTALRLGSDGSVASRRRFQVDRPSARAIQMGLAPGRYVFRVQAVNTFGTSPLSAPSNVAQAR